MKLSIAYSESLEGQLDFGSESRRANSGVVGRPLRFARRSGWEKDTRKKGWPKLKVAPEDQAALNHDKNYRRFLRSDQ